MQRLKLKHILFLLLLIRCIFIALPDTPIHPFPAAGEEMSTMLAFQYGFRLIEQLTLFTVVVVLWLVSIGKIEITSKRQVSISAFMLICGLDLIDFLFRGNTEWFFFGDYPVTANVLMLPLYWLLTSFFFDGD